MPVTQSLQLQINNQQVDIGPVNDLNISIDYILEQPESFESKQGASAQAVQLPATKNNDQVFNTFWKHDVENNYPTSGLASLILIGTGAGYVVGDTVTISGGSVPATATITSVGGLGGVVTFTIDTPGSGYVFGAVVNFIGGSGAGATGSVSGIVTAPTGPKEIMDAILYVNGTVPILKGKALLLDASHTTIPEEYNISLFGNSGDWLIDMQNLTLWDCVSKTPHTFDVSTVQTSWSNALSGGYDSDEDHDFVYAPVRYRQPFGDNDDTVNIYDLRPSISVYWLIIRAFRQFGYTVQSEFLGTQYFRRQVLPWVWGSFYDINSQITQGLSFKAAGVLPVPTPPSDRATFPGAPPIYTGDPAFPATESGWGGSVSGPVGITGTKFIFTDVAGGFGVFNMSNVLPPNGSNNFGLYEFDDTTGTMKYTFNPPVQFLPYISGNSSINFQLKLYLGMQIIAGSSIDCQIEVIQNSVLISSNSILPTGLPFGGGGYPSVAEQYFPLSPTTYNFTVSNVAIGDILEFKLKFVQSGVNPGAVKVACSGYINVNPIDTGASTWQYNPVTQKWGNVDSNVADYIWQPTYSTFEMTGLQIELGNSVDFQFYDGFRGHMFLDLLRGLVDTYDWEIQTDPINKTVIIEPFMGVTLPDYDVDGNYTGDIDIAGYFSRERILDYTTKQDLNQKNTMSLFSNMERQIDFGFKQDGGDGGQNIYSLRNLGIYLNQVSKPYLANTTVTNGIIAGIPGASRYMLPNRFAKGNKQKNNRFFSSCMHYKHTPWENIWAFSTTSPAPQLIAIFPENINDSSASAVTQTFTPKLAFYKGLRDPEFYGGWRWIGDPASPYTDGGTPSAIGFELPYMFSVNYNKTPVASGASDKDPILSYCDQLVYDTAGNPTIAPGLMRKFFLPRLAIMRNGQLYRPYLRLNLNDICNFAHREAIKIGNSMFALIGIEGYKPLKDESCETTMWKIVSPTQADIENCFPSEDSIENQPATLSENDLKYAQLLLFITDIPTS